MKKSLLNLTLSVSFINVLVVATASVASAQSPVITKDRGKEMLTAIKEDLREYYYDPTFRGLNVDA
ncbi:MAG TPA: hypothetical protein VFZ40_07900, partial [Pyrinomonadaceae bacterium]